MSSYQVIARRFRPRLLKQVIGQEAVVTTIRNALARERIGHAYLFCGPRGTGKTSLARLLAKALNCTHRNAEQEPCDQCASCSEIAAGCSMDVIELDGASHRGIEDVRQICEGSVYTAPSGGYRIYIIDEVHMLTKEAFNALLKTLEEPPARVVFLMATTEPHKIPATVLSRAQRFHLQRLSPAQIVQKLALVIQELGTTAEPEALQLLSQLAEGGLRDAESMLDHAMAYVDGPLTATAVAQALGLLPTARLFELHRAVQTGNASAALRLGEELFCQGVDLSHFLTLLAQQIRLFMIHNIDAEHPSLTPLSSQERQQIAAHAQGYSAAQCLRLLDLLTEVQQQLTTAPSKRVAIEAMLLKMVQTRHWMPLDQLVQRLEQLERQLQTKPAMVVEQAKPAEAPARPKPVEAARPKPAEPAAPVQAPAAAPAPPLDKAESVRHQTILQFAAIELEGSLSKPS
jgi:DNA polymerase III subunit gamma/tau